MEAAEGPTLVGLVMLAAEGCQRLKAAAALTWRTQGSVQETLAALSWKGWRLMSVAPHNHSANVHTFVLLPADLQSEGRGGAFLPLDRRMERHFLEEP